jgi:hypothetical protein
VRIFNPEFPKKLSEILYFTVGEMEKVLAENYWPKAAKISHPLFQILCVLHKQKIFLEKLYIIIIKMA